MAKAKRDTYQEVTDRIIALIEEGQATGDWTRPWRVAASAGLPANALTRRRYRGINVLMLWAGAQRSGFTSNEWGTYRQWAQKGAQVRGGEHGELVVFFKRITVPDDEAENGRKEIPLLRFSTVFNADQVDGYDTPQEPEPDGADTLERIEEWVKATGATIRENGGRAYYDPSGDYIGVPRASQFTSTEARYSTLLHELTHWSGHPDRLARNLSLRFGDEAYAMEELIAELGSAYLCGAHGLEPVAREDHAQYVAHWLKVMRGDKKAIVTAASKASDAADYLDGLTREASLDEMEMDALNRSERVPSVKGHGINE